MYTIQRWEGGGPVAHLSSKTPTVLLLTPEGEFDSFGYEAENKYLQLVEDEKQEGWRYFKHFKMQLYKNLVGLIQITVMDVIWTCVN